MRPCRLSLLLLPLLAGCLAQTPQTPMQTLVYTGADGQRQPHLLVLLRGFGAGNDIFAKEGIIDEIRRRRLPFDIVAPDAHFGYYQAHSVEKRLHDDIIEPYRQLGYRQVWLAGFSMGGMGSLFYLRSYTDEVDGVLLTSPFLGWGELAEEIRNAGGVSAWQATTTDEEQWERLIWSFIKGFGSRRDDYPPVYLGYGENDLLTASGPALLATVLPPEQVFSVPGNHTVATFKRIFYRHLDRLEELFPQSAAQTATASREHSATTP